MIYVASLACFNSNIYLSQLAQIKVLNIVKIFTTFPNNNKYFTNIFSFNLAKNILEYMRINNFAIQFINNQKPLYRLYYNIKSMKLEIYKIYIIIYLANVFIKSSKFLTELSIYFLKILDKNIYYK